MSSFILHDHIHHSILFPYQPLSCLFPCVFGCTCSIHILTPQQDKLSTKGMEYVFLGYSRPERGYKCYSPDTNQYFISVTITSFKGSPFSSAKHPHVPNILPLPLISTFPDLPSPSTDVLPQPLQVYTLSTLY